MRVRGTTGHRIRATVATLLGVGALLGVTACGGSDEPDTTTAADGGSARHSINMAVVPAATFAPVFVGVDQGIFDKHGVDLKIDVGGLAPTVFPRLLKDQVQLGANTWGTLVTSAEQGLPLVGIASVDRGGTSPEDDYQGIVAKKGGAKTLKELEGKTIAVPTLKSFTDSQARAVLAEAGVDTEKVKFLAIPFPDMPAALAAGRVDAVALVEPFFTQTKKDGGVPLASLSRGQAMGAIVAAKKWVEGNPEAVAAFREAWSETLQYSIDHPEAVRAALTAGLKIPEPVAAAMTLPHWDANVPAEDVQQIADMMKQVGAVKNGVSAADVMSTPN